MNTHVGQLFGVFLLAAYMAGIYVGDRIIVSPLRDIWSLVWLMIVGLVGIVGAVFGKVISDKVTNTPQ